MKRHLNTLYVTTPGSYLRKEGESVVVRIEKKTRAHLPLHNLDGIVCFGNVMTSPYLLGACAERGVSVTLLSTHGRFLARVQGPVAGNVLLRREQYRRADDSTASADLARSFLIGKLANSREVLLRALRDREQRLEELEGAARYLEQALGELRRTSELDSLRGVEGGAARAYYGVFSHLVLQQNEDFLFEGRNRRPPRDRMNALLSFLYTLVRHDVESALEGVGLDPAVGFLHRDRPGRPSLALDMMEEFRPHWADRTALTLVNRRQLGPSDFTQQETGAVWLTDEGRKKVLTAYQERKEAEVIHPFLEERVTTGLFPHLQALLLARHLRGDLDQYPPMLLK